MQFLIRAIFFLLFLTSCSFQLHLTEKKPGEKLPITKFTLLNGSYLGTEDLSGKTLVIAFWATTCHFSRPVMEKLNDYAKKFEGRKDIQFLAVSLDKQSNYEVFLERIQSGRLDRFTHCFSGNEGYDEAYMSAGGNDLPLILVVAPDRTILGIGDDMDVVYQALGK